MKMRIRHLITAASLVAVAAIVAPTSVHAATGDLTQKANPDGCISEIGTGGACVDGAALDGAASVTVSPNGKSAYVASQNSDGVAVFDRDTTTGKLTQKVGTDGCISETGTGGACVPGVALDSVQSVTLSPDGRNAYIASSGSDAVAVFDRDTSTGKLAQKAGTDGCIAEDNTVVSLTTCDDGKALNGASSVTVSPDGTSAYVASYNGDAVAVFDRNTTTGALTQKADPDGCLTNSATAGCTTGTALNGPFSVTVSPDGTSAYVASLVSGAVAVFDRNTTTGALTQKADPDGCITNSATAGCTTGKALDGAISVTVSPDGTSAYVASLLSDAVAVFDRDAATGKLAQKAGTDGCIAEDNTVMALTTCDDGVALDGAMSVTISPDGASAYIASNDADAVAVFDRDTATGKLTQKSLTDGCVSETGTGGACVVGVALNGAISVTVSPDGRSTYVASLSSNAVAVFDRNDGIAPTTTITSGPQGATNSTSASFGFTSNEAGSTFECRLNDAAFAACSSPKSYSALTDGPHTFAVRATDKSGNTEATPAERSFTVDTTLSGSASAKKTQKQKGSKIKLKLKLKAQESLSAKGSGKVKLGKKSYKLKPKSTNVAAGANKNLTLKPKKNKDTKKIVKALKQGKKAKAKLKVKMTDELTNTKSTKLSVKLKR